MRRVLACAAVLAACGHDPVWKRPADPAERERAEFGACLADRWPAWLDDRALEEAVRIDGWGHDYVDPKDSFREWSPYSHQSSLPSTRRGSPGTSRQASIEEERRDFRARCNLMKAVAPPARSPTSAK
jgi:hypothetical protein